MKPSPTIAEIELAFRQAKTLLYLEKHGFGPPGLATDEEKLSENLKAPQDRLEIGETWIEPASDHQRARDDCPLVARLGTLIHRDRVAVQGRLETAIGSAQSGPLTLIAGAHLLRTPYLPGVHNVINKLDIAP